MMGSMYIDEVTKDMKKQFKVKQGGHTISGPMVTVIKLIKR